MEVEMTQHGKRVIMYSVTPNGVVVHRFLIDPDTDAGRLKLQKYERRGFTYEDPRPKTELSEASTSVAYNVCSVCGRACKSEFGLKSHMRSHNKDG
jgi:hypothetical protein